MLEDTDSVRRAFSRLQDEYLEQARGAPRNKILNEQTGHQACGGDRP